MKMSAITHCDARFFTDAADDCVAVVGAVDVDVNQCVCAAMAGIPSAKSTNLHCIKRPFKAMRYFSAS